MGKGADFFILIDCEKNTLKVPNGTPGLGAVIKAASAENKVKSFATFGDLRDYIAAFTGFGTRGRRKDDTL